MRTVYTKLTFSAGVVLSLSLVLGLAAADKPARLSGTVLSMDKDSHQITLQQGTAGTAHRTIMFDANTKFTAGSPSDTKVSAPATANDVKAGNYLTCEGTWSDVKLAATVCTVRPSKHP